MTSRSRCASECACACGAVEIDDVAAIDYISARGWRRGAAASVGTRIRQPESPSVVLSLSLSLSLSIRPFVRLPAATDGVARARVCGDRIDRRAENLLGSSIEAGPFAARTDVCRRVGVDRRQCAAAMTTAAAAAAASSVIGRHLLTSMST